jgi:hypothetical protein
LLAAREIEEGSGSGLIKGILRRNRRKPRKSSDGVISFVVEMEWKGKERKRRKGNEKKEKERKGKQGKQRKRKGMKGRTTEKTEEYEGGRTFQRGRKNI